MAAFQRLRTWITPISPRTWAMMLFVLALIGYVFTTSLPLSRMITVVILLGTLLLLMPVLLANHAQLSQIRAACLVLIPIALVMLGVQAASLLWLVLLIPTLALPKLISLQSAWIILGAVWIGWIVSSFAFALALSVFDVILTACAMMVVMAWVSLRRASLPVVVPTIKELPIQRVTRASERLRGTASVQELMEELASAAKACGSFSFASAAHVDLRTDLFQVLVALGASGRTLGATESLTLAWSEILPLLNETQRVSDTAFLADKLPYRQATNEQHLLVPLRTSAGEIFGMLTVSDAADQARQRLIELAPLLELLAAQAAAALEASSLQTTLAQRVEATTAEIGRNAEDALRARSRAESMYQIVRSLSTTLEPQPLLDQALLLIAQATQAERGGIMLVEPRTGRLVFGTNLDRTVTRVDAIALERGQGLAGWVAEHQEPVIIPDTAADDRWQVRSEYDQKGRSAMAVPMIQDEHVTGVIILIKNTLNHFTHEHVQFVRVIGDQVSTMLANVSQYQAAVEQANKASQMLEQREEEVSRSLAIVRSIGDGVVVGDRVGRIRLINPAAETMLNINPSEFLGKSLASLPGAPDNAQTLDHHQVQQDFELNNRVIRAYSMPVFTNQNDWMGSVIVYHDITTAQLADRMKTEFVATASHELRTPLTSIKGYIDLLMMGTLGEINHQQHQFLAVVQTNIERLNAILNDLLDVSRIESGQVRLQRGEVNIHELLQGTVMLIHQQWGHKEISLALDVPSDLPPIIADEDRLRQVMTNLVSNAYKYTPHGGRIDLVARNGGDSVVIMVKDNGVGIAEADQPLIFSRFFRADNPLKESAGGTGLGLSITKSLVELHGGRIWFDSVANKGTTFHVQLPIGGDADWTPAPWLSGV